MEQKKKLLLKMSRICQPWETLFCSIPIGHKIEGQLVQKREIPREKVVMKDSTVDTQQNSFKSFSKPLADWMNVLSLM